MIARFPSLFPLLVEAGWIGVLSLTGRAAIGAAVGLPSQTKLEEFVGSRRCAECHRDIASVQLSQ